MKEKIVATDAVVIVAAEIVMIVVAKEDVTTDAMIEEKIALQEMIAVVSRLKNVAVSLAKKMNVS